MLEHEQDEDDVFGNTVDSTAWKARSHGGFSHWEGDANGDGQKESPGKDARGCGNEEGFAKANSVPVLIKIAYWHYHDIFKKLYLEYFPVTSISPTFKLQVPKKLAYFVCHSEHSTFVTT